MSRGKRDVPGTARFPAAGAYRVAEDPTRLATGPWERGTGPNRYDDPLGRFSVRYLSDTLEGCLKEKLAQFRRHTEAERRIDALRERAAAATRVAGLAGVPLPPGPDHDQDAGLLPFLVAQRVASIRVRWTTTRFVDIAADSTARFLRTQQLVRTVLGTPSIRRALSPRRPPYLTVAVLTEVSTPRELTQAVSRVVYEHGDDYAGIAFPSCIDRLERCWAVFGRTRVGWDDDGKFLLSAGPEAMRALVAAAAFTKVTLPHQFTD